LGTSIPAWQVIFHDDFDAEFDDLTAGALDALLAAASALKLAGPKLGRPTVDTLKGSTHSNMKELRFRVDKIKEVWRAAFAFDPNQNAIVLCAAEKQGVNERAFYRALITKADKRFDDHLEQVEQAKAVAFASSREQEMNVSKRSSRSTKYRKGK
jgi:hypothetical protein